MASKTICVLIQHSPFRKLEAAEALRMAVGLTLRDNEVYVLFVGESLETFSKRGSKGQPKADIGRHLDALSEFDQTIVVEKESIEEPADFDLPDYLEIWTREGIFRLLGKCDATIVV